MQWSGDKNAGFSGADPARLYLPLIIDPVYGYGAINVEAQERPPWSLLNWMRRLIATRKKTRAFGRGTLTFLRARNESVLAHLRVWEGETVLAVHNLSGAAEPVEIELADHAGWMPVEMLSDSRFPVIGTEPYFLSLAPYGYYWFRLQPPLSDQPFYGIENTPL
jgi:maltose alpha-D-glucosyltransferase / alpha-amylase